MVALGLLDRDWRVSQYPTSGHTEGEEKKKKKKRLRRETLRGKSCEDDMVPDIEERHSLES